MDHTWAYANEWLRIRAGHQKDYMIRWLKFWTSPTSRESTALKTEFYHMANFSIIPMQWNYNKNFVCHAWLDSLVGENINVLAGWQTLIPREMLWKLHHLWNPTKLHSIYLFHLAVSICVIYNETIIIPIPLSWVLWVILVNCQTLAVLGL